MIGRVGCKKRAASWDNSRSWLIGIYGDGWFQASPVKLEPTYVGCYKSRGGAAGRFEHFDVKNCVHRRLSVVLISENL
jgi:hypothetical protein